jgi:Kinesin motor domain
MSKLNLAQGDYTAPKVKIRKRSVINFVDLAGSERQFTNDADRLKETCQINKSLVVLSNVISNLMEGNKKFLHFRDSK